MILLLFTSPNWARIENIRPLNASNPFGFQQALPLPPAEIQRKYVSVDTGGMAVCAIREMDRGIDCWGLNDLGPASPPSTGKFRMISIGSNLGCGLTQGNQLLCWGPDSFQPTPSDLAGKYVSVSTGDNVVCAIESESRGIRCWGKSSVGATTPPTGPFKTLSARQDKVCGVRTNGLVACWGDPAFLAYPIPNEIFSDVSVGTLHACGILKKSSEILCWGNNSHGETRPPKGKYVSITSGTDHTCALNRNHKVLCWGSNKEGQLDLPIGSYQEINGGGFSTCGLSSKREIACRGQFVSIPPGLAISSQSTPSYTALKLNGISGSLIENFVGSLMVSWGDSADGGMNKALLFIGGLLGKESDAATQRKLDEIQNKLDEIRTDIRNVDQKTDLMWQDIKALQCDSSLAQLDAAVKNINAAMLEYSGSTDPKLDTGSLANKILKEMTYRQQPGYAPVDLRPDVRKFRDNWFNKVRADLESIDKALMDQNFAKGPLGYCLERSYDNYSGSAADKRTPFDDRKIYRGLYTVLMQAIALQSLGYQMELDMNKFSAIDALTNPVDENYSGIPVIPSSSGTWTPETLCKDARLHKSQNRRWDDAISACDSNDAFLRTFYRNLVQQVEYAGAPYTDEDVILSMGADLYGYGKANTNWLWVRNYDSKLAGGLQGEPDLWWMSPTLLSSLRGVTAAYVTGGVVDKLGTWRSDGGAWNELFDNYIDYRIKTPSDTGYSLSFRAGFYDVLSLMSDTASDFDNQPLFTGIRNLPFWMTYRTFTLNFLTLTPGLQDHDFDHFLDGLQCFVGSGIGRVCSSDEMGRISVTKQVDQTFWHDDRAFGSPDNDAKVWPYKGLLGSWTVWYRMHSAQDGSPIWNYLNTTSEANFWPDKKNQTLIYRMPVLDVSQRTCTDSMVIANKSPRTGNRIVQGKRADGTSGSIQVPTRCGADMDYAIDQLIQRPTVSDLDPIVRRPAPIQ